MTIAANFKPLLDTYNLWAESEFMPHQLCFGTSVLQFYRQDRVSDDKRGVLKTFWLTRIPIRPFTCKTYERLLVSIKNQINSRTRKNLEREFIIFLLDTYTCEILVLTKKKKVKEFFAFTFDDLMHISVF